MITIDDFFKPAMASNISEDNYSILPAYINAVDILAKTTYQSVYLIDYNKKEFLYVSKNPLFLCGLAPQQVTQMGYSFYFEKVPEKDLEMLLEINAAGFEFFQKTPVDERLDYLISYDFHLAHPDNKQILINHKLTPLLLDNNHNIWISLCVVSVSTKAKAGNVELRNIKDGTVYTYSFEKGEWGENKQIELTPREREIVLLSARGFTINEIAEKIFLSPDTIKFHRKNLFHKIGVQTIAEVILYATNYNLI